MAAKESSVFVIILKLSPEFAAKIALSGVIDAVADAARAGRPPIVQEFERLGYLQRLRQAGTLRAAGPFEDLREGMYLCTAADEHEADAYWKKNLCIVPD